MSKHYAKVTDVSEEDHVDRIYSDAMEIPDLGNDVLIKDNAGRHPDYYNILKTVDGLQGFKRYKTTGAGPVFVMTERTDVEIQGTTEYTDNETTRTKTGNRTKLSYKGNTTSLTYEDTATFIFQGSDIEGDIRAISVLFRQVGTTSTSSIRVRDVTNNQTICELTGIGSEGKIRKDLGAISNVPTDEAVFELQCKVGDVADTAKTFQILISH